MVFSFLNQTNRVFSRWSWKFLWMWWPESHSFGPAITWFKIDLNLIGGENTRALLRHARLFCWCLHTIASFSALVSDIPTLFCRRIHWYVYGCQNLKCSGFQHGLYLRFFLYVIPCSGISNCKSSCCNESQGGSTHGTGIGRCRCLSVCPQELGNDEDEEEESHDDGEKSCGVLMSHTTWYRYWSTSNSLHKGPFGLVRLPQVKRYWAHVYMRYYIYFFRR